MHSVFSRYNDPQRVVTLSALCGLRFLLYSTSCALCYGKSVGVTESSTWGEYFLICHIHSSMTTLAAPKCSRKHRSSKEKQTLRELSPICVETEAATRNAEARPSIFQNPNSRTCIDTRCQQRAKLLSKRS